MRKRDIKVGHWARIRWDDIGVADVFVIQADYDLHYIKIYDPARKTTQSIEACQFILIGPELGNVPVF